MKRDLRTFLITLTLFLLTQASSRGVEIARKPVFTGDHLKMTYMEQGQDLTIKLYDWGIRRTEELSFPRPVFDPKLSQDGRKLFFLELSEDSYYSELWYLDLESGEDIRLTDRTYGDIYSYAVSPNNSDVAFITFKSGQTVHGTEYQEMFLLSLDDMAARSIAVFDRLNIDTFVTPLFSGDGSRILFSYGSTIYLMDLTDSQTNEINLGLPIYFLSVSADPRYGVFTGLSDAFYQIFLLDMQDGSLQQLTYTNSNKILPHMDLQGNVYYIDCGESWDFRKLAWLGLLIDYPYRFKAYRNNWGRLGWGASYVLDFLVASYRAFRDEYFLQVVGNHAKWLMQNTDIESGIRDYNGESTYGWSATRYSADEQSSMRYAVHTGMICSPLAEFAVLCLDDAGLQLKFGDIVQELVRVLPDFAAALDDEFVEHDMDPLSITQEDEGYYIFPKGSPFHLDGANVPFNQQNQMGIFLISLYNITGEHSYLDKALKLGRVFKRNLIETDGMYEWHYSWGKASIGWTAEEDISVNTLSYAGHDGYDGGYSRIEMDFACKLHPYGVFDDADIQRFVATYLSAPGRNRLRPKDVVKIGACLLQYEEAVAGKAENIDVLTDIEHHVPYQIPYMSFILGNSGSSRWVLKRRETDGLEKVLPIKGSLVSFSVSGDKVYSIHKEPGSSYFVMENVLSLIPTDCLKGDVNGDGQILFDDAILVLYIATGLMGSTNDQKCAADMDDDGEVRSNDAILILREVTGLAAPNTELIAGINKRVTITLPEAHGIAGERITVPVKVDNVDILASGDLCIAYNSAVLQVIDVSTDSDALLVCNTAEPGTVRIAFAGTSSINSRTLAEIQFHILTDNVSSLIFESAELYDPDARPLSLSRVNSEFRSWAVPPEQSALLQNFPNPFNPGTWIPYQLREDSDVAICIYSLSGKLVQELPLGHRSAGLYVSQNRAAYWDGRNESGELVVSGIYFAVLKASEYQQVRCMTIIK